MSHSVMGKKTKRLYDRMKYGIGVKDSKAAALQAKAEALEAAADGNKGTNSLRREKRGETSLSEPAGAPVRKARRKQGGKS